MAKDVERFCKRCRICQTTKIDKKKYGLLPPKEAEVEPWHQLCVDLIGPYKIPIKKICEIQRYQKEIFNHMVCDYDRSSHFLV